MPRNFFIFLKKQFGDKPLFGGEIGVKRGENAEQIIAYLNIERLYLVDLWLAYSDNILSGEREQGYASQKIMDSWYQETLQKFKNDSRIFILKKESIQIASKFISSIFDFIYIDATHTYEAVLNDCIAWFPKLRSDGYLGGHDYFNKSTQVKKAVDDFALTIGKKVNSEGEDWWLTD